MNNLDPIHENIVEISRLFERMWEHGMLRQDIDSRDAASTIADLAIKFEEKTKEIDWDSGSKDYYEELEKFAEERLLFLYDNDR